MSILHKKNEDVFKIFKKNKVMTIKQLANLFNCSDRTVQRRLIKWRTYTSYNYNGKYYVLSTIPKFDENGLWSFNEIFFSKNGNLRQTIVALINNSPAGLTVSETANLVNVPLSSFMSQDRNLLNVKKEKISGLFVYFSSSEAIYIKQKDKRQKNIINLKLAKFPTDAEAIIILIELIKHPTLNLKQLSVKLNKKNEKIKIDMIRSLFFHHGLLKKTMDTQ